MFPTTIIAFREFFEAFLIVGVFLGISAKLNLKKEKEIVFAACVGFLIALIFSSLTYTFAAYARTVLTHESSELLEAYLMVFSGCFLAYVIFSLHSMISRGKGAKLLQAHKKLETKQFDISLFVLIVFLVAREGFEIALFTATASLFSSFIQNFIGLVIGFAMGAVIGCLSYLSYLRFPVARVFRATEYMIILLGASLVQNGLSELIEQVFQIHLNDVLQIPLSFLPDPKSMLGHLIQTFTGLDREFSIPRLMIMLGYGLVIYFLFLRKQTRVSSVKTFEKS